MLGRHKLFMLPTRHGIYFTVVLIAMLLAAVNYNNGMAYMFTFLLGSMALVSMLYTHKNLVGLIVRPGPAESVFAGDNAKFIVHLNNHSKISKSAVCIQETQTKKTSTTDIQPQQVSDVQLVLPTFSRGYLSLPSITITSSFPLGLLYTWSRSFRLRSRCLIYPKPISLLPLESQPDRQRLQESGTNREGDDFAGLRQFQEGDPPRHVHWKAVARGQELQTKLFAGSSGAMVWLDWNALEGLNTEERLGQLCHWVIEAQQKEMSYGLRLNDKEIAPDNGEEHRNKCLSALALWGT